MAETNEIGKKGEEIAYKYLESQGYDILETNWRLGHLEADIIAAKDGILVFAEVKTRRSDEYGAPEDFVDKRKQRAYVKIANNYILTNKRTDEARFDIIAIITDGQSFNIKHIPNAFTVVDALYR